MMVAIIVMTVVLTAWRFGGELRFLGIVVASIVGIIAGPIGLHASRSGWQSDSRSVVDDSWRSSLVDTFVFGPPWLVCGFATVLSLMGLLASALAFVLFGLMVEYPPPRAAIRDACPRGRLNRA